MTRNDRHAGAIEHWPGGFIPASRLQGRSRLSALEEPYVEPTYLNKPILEIYDSNTVDGMVNLESPESSFGWIRAHKSVFVDAEERR